MFRKLVFLMAVTSIALGSFFMGCSARQCPTGYHEENGECVADEYPSRNPEQDVGNERKPAPKP